MRCNDHPEERSCSSVDYDDPIIDIGCGLHWCSAQECLGTFSQRTSLSAFQRSPVSPCPTDVSRYFMRAQNGEVISGA